MRVKMLEKNEEKTKSISPCPTPLLFNNFFEKKNDRREQIICLKNELT